MQIVSPVSVLKRIFIGLAAVCMLLLVAGLVTRVGFGDPIAEGYLAGELSRTIVRLSRTGNEDAQALLLAANCYRQLGQQQLFLRKVDQIQALSDSDNVVSLALAMNSIQHGQLDASPPQLLNELRGAGALEADARSVVIQGTLARNRLSEAEQLLDAWREEQPHSPQLEYLTAVYFNVCGRSDDAEAKLIEAIERYPRHELSWLALAELYSRPPNVRFLQGELVLERFTARFPHNSSAGLQLARMKRRLGHASQERVAPPTADETDAEVLERAKIAFDLGNFGQAVALLKAAGMAAPEDFNRLTDRSFQLSLQGQGDAGGELGQRVSWGATALALSGEHESATEIFDVAIDRTARLRRLQDLSVKQAVFSPQQAITDEMNALGSPAFTPNYPTLEKLAAKPDTAAGAMPGSLPGMTLYLKHCANCHGEDGNGFGPAACNLFPLPRSFRAEPVRLVSATNRLATDADLARIIRQGEPGTSMPAFKQLTESDIQQLIQVLRWFIVDGLHQLYAREAALNQDWGEAGRATESSWVASRSEPAGPLDLPPSMGSTALSTHGQSVFKSAGCGGCHAIHQENSQFHGRLFDSLGRPLAAPDLALDYFHGGDDREQIFRRIRLGIPGTPHPEFEGLSPGDVEALVAYITEVRSMNPRVKTNYERSTRANQDVAVGFGQQD